MTDPVSAEGRIDALRKAIDHAVSGLNKSWGGFGPNVQLERVISSLQRARTNDDIAQGRDWPPVVLTDRASAEGLREAIDAALHELGEPGPGYPAPVANAVDILRAALRDTGPRPDSGIDHALHYDPSCEECAYLARPVMLPRPDSGIDGKTVYTLWDGSTLVVSVSDTDPGDIGEPRSVTADGVTYLTARLSTPRTETSE